MIEQLYISGMVRLAGEHLGELVPHLLNRLNKTIRRLVGNLVQAHSLPAQAGQGQYLHLEVLHVYGHPLEQMLPTRYNVKEHGRGRHIGGDKTQPRQRIYGNTNG